MQAPSNNDAPAQVNAGSNHNGRGGRGIDAMDIEALRRYAKELRRDKGRMGGLICRLRLRNGLSYIEPTPVERRVHAHEPSVYDIKEWLRAMNSHLREKDTRMVDRALKMQRVTDAKMITDLAEDGDELDEGLKAVDTTAKEMREGAGEVECVICLQQLEPGQVFKPAWCAHVMCIGCIDRYKTQKGELVPCPMHCEGNACSGSYWTKFVKAVEELQNESVAAAAGAAHPEETPQAKVSRWLREDRIKFVKTANNLFELAVDGPASNKRVQSTVDERINIFRAKDSLKLLPDPFKWDKTGTVCGVAKSWYRPVQAESVA